MADNIYISIAGIIIPTAVFCAGLLQYTRAQAWKRYEFVVDQIKEFKSNPSVRNAMQVIDWGKRNIELRPEHSEYDQRFIWVDRKKLLQALAIHTEVNRDFTNDETLIRDTFDEFFGYLDRFEQFIKANLVKQEDFAPYLIYWVKAITFDVRPELRTALYRYMSNYGFDGAQELLNRYQTQVPKTPRNLPIQFKSEEIGEESNGKEGVHSPRTLDT